jgi:hypothetical protein
VLVLLVPLGLIAGCGGAGATSQGVRDAINQWNRALEAHDYRGACALAFPSFKQLVQLGAASTGLDPVATLDRPPDCPRQLRWLATGHVKYAPAYVIAIRRVRVTRIEMFRTRVAECARVTITCLTAGCQAWVPVTLCYVRTWKLVAPV